MNVCHVCMLASAVSSSLTVGSRSAHPQTLPPRLCHCQPPLFSHSFLALLFFQQRCIEFVQRRSLHGMPQWKLHLLPFPIDSELSIIFLDRNSVRAKERGDHWTQTAPKWVHARMCQTTGCHFHGCVVCRLNYFTKMNIPTQDERRRVWLQQLQQPTFAVWEMQPTFHHGIHRQDLYWTDQ